MENNDIPTPCWNIFACELASILARRGLRIGHLDDRQTVGIHREMVRRLQKSMQKPISFPVLSPDDLRRVEETFGLAPQERLYLRAAILATAIEEELIKHIFDDDALLAAQQIFPLIVRALEKYNSTKTGLGAFLSRQDDTEQEDVMLDEGRIDLALATALHTLDRAMKGLYLDNIEAHSERISVIRRAQHGFEQALSELSEINEDIQETETWQAWVAEARKGLQKADAMLKDLTE